MRSIKNKQGMRGIEGGVRGGGGGRVKYEAIDSCIRAPIQFLGEFRGRRSIRSREIQF